MKNIGRLSKIGLRAFQRNEQKTQYYKFTLVLITTRNNCKIKQDYIYIYQKQWKNTKRSSLYSKLCPFVIIN